MKRYLANQLTFLSRLANYAEGKGYGAKFSLTSFMVGGRFFKTSIPSEIDCIATQLEGKPNLAIDIGGNIGDYSAELKRKFKALEIHIFEPSKVNISKLSTRFSADPLIHIIPKAASNEVTDAVIYSDSPGSGLGSLTKRDLQHLDITFEISENVKTIRFEDYWNKELGRKIIDFVKIDIEGHELDALHGFGEAIQYTKLIQFEFGGCNIDTRTFFKDFWNFFKVNNFSLFRISPLGLIPITSYLQSDECFSITNYVAKNNVQLLEKTSTHPL